jgi:DNA-binding NarL/FixJ family response regulator
MEINLKVLIYDHDLFALHAINSYLAWDRRTRVHCLAATVEEAFEWLTEEDESEWPDIVILDTYYHQQATELGALIRRFRQVGPHFRIMIFDHEANLERVLAAYEGGASAYFVRNELSIYVASSLVWASQTKFGVTPNVKEKFAASDQRLQKAEILPERREYPDMTERIRQAVQLCVVEGMSAELAADEMGVSTHTIRSYIKEGYRILESYDVHPDHPSDLSAQERAFIRFTSLEDKKEDKNK